MPVSDDAWKPKYNPWLIATAVMLATFMEVMDTSIASVAVPYIAGSTASTTDEAEWVLTVYLATNAVFLPASAWFAERFGRKRFLMWSLLVFTLASFACGIAPSLGFILLARALQGAAGGALQPLALAVLLDSFPKEKQGQALGLYTVGIVVAPVVGPLFGGYLTDALTWRWAFFINIPIGALALLLQGKFLEDPPYFKSLKPGKLDGVGLGLLGIWIAGMQYMLDEGQEQDWFGDERVRWAIACMVIFFIIFIVYELRHKNPLVDLRVFRDRNFAVGCVLIFVTGVAIYSLVSLLPVLYQNLLGYDATHSGIAVSPRGLGSFVAALVVGALSTKLDPRKVIAAGFLVIAVTALWLGTLTLDISPTSLFWRLIFSGCGISMVFATLSGVSLGTISKSQTGNASGIFNFLRNVGGSVGIAVANTISLRHLQAHRNDNVHWFTSSNIVFQRALRLETQRMLMHADPRIARLRAFDLLNTSLNNQAQLWAYVDVFRYLALLCAICVPAAFLFKKPKPGAKGAPG